MDGLLAFDHLARTWIITHRVGALDGPMWLLSVAGRGGLIWLLVAAVFAVRDRSARLLASTALAALLATTVADHLIKPLVGRQRPFLQPPADSVIGGRPDDASFPSGHAANAFACAAVLSEAGWSAWWILAVATAYSRVYLGVHYPLDVCAGAMVGLICGLIALAVERRLAGPRSSRQPVRDLLPAPPC